MTDAELLRQAQSGDRSAWRLLYARCLPSVWRHAVASVENRPAAEDIVGETFMALVQGLSGLDPEQTDVQAWLRGVLRRKIVDHYRQRSRNRRLHSAVRNESSTEEGVPPSPCDLETEEDRQQVLKALDELPEQQRTFLEWKYVEALSVREIAERSGKSEKAIESTLFRARKEFRRLYERVIAESPVIGHTSETFERSL